MKQTLDNADTKSVVLDPNVHRWVTLPIPDGYVREQWMTPDEVQEDGLVTVEGEIEDITFQRPGSDEVLYLVRKE
jgi:hypothetical protein